MPLAAFVSACALAATWELSDRRQDGTPDFLRLSDPTDRDAFRDWFRFLAESLYFKEPSLLPASVRDCSGLVRFAYREALRRHDGAWATELGLDAVPPLPSLARFQYPNTPLKANLFRVRAGAFSPPDLGNGAFAEFADAKTILRYNTHPVGGDPRAWQPGDLLFFRQASRNFPLHVMVYLGESTLTPGPERFVVYHTGPEGRDPGEVRRPSLAELNRHPEARWRPVISNENFLGAFRWNILAD